MRPGGRREPGALQLLPAGVALFLVAVVALSRGSGIDPRVAGVVGGTALSALLVGTAWSLLSMARLKLMVRSPGFATVGETVPLEVDVAGPTTGVLLRALDPTGPWQKVVPGTNRVAHLAEARGVYRVLRVQLWCRGGLGVLGRRRLVEIDLGHEVLVAPRSTPMSWRPEPLADELAESTPCVEVHRAGETARAVRPYAPGDPARMVHWPSSLRTGELVVRELEPPQHHGLAVVLWLAGPGDDAERAASRAMGLCSAVLAGGGSLLLCTIEATGPVAAPVNHPQQAGRRLARAVWGEPGKPPKGWPVEVLSG